MEYLKRKPFKAYKLNPNNLKHREQIYALVHLYVMSKHNFIELHSQFNLSVTRLMRNVYFCVSFILCIKFFVIPFQVAVNIFGVLELT